MRHLAAVLLLLTLASGLHATAPTDAEAKLAVLLDVWHQQLLAPPHPAKEARATLAGANDVAELTTRGTSLEFGTIEGCVARMVSVADNAVNVRVAAVAYLTAVRQEQEAAAAKMEASLVTLEKKCGEDCFAARSPGDLDHTLVMLMDFDHQLPPKQYPNNPESRRVGDLKGFVTQWQDYLVCKANGDFNGENANLRSLAGRLNFVPRSKILALIPSVEPVDQTAGPFFTAVAMVAQMRMLAQLPGTVESIRQLPETQPANRDGMVRSGIAEHLLTPLNGLLAAYRAVQAGVTSGKLENVDHSPFVFPEDDPRITAAARTSLAALNRELTLLTLASYLRVPDSLQPKPAELTDAYLDRVITTAVRSDNWALALDALDLWNRPFPYGQPPAWLAAEITACKLQMLARNLELAGDYTAALGLNLRLLRLVSKYVAPEAVGQKVSELRQAHPEVYDDAVAFAGAEDKVNALLK